MPTPFIPTQRKLENKHHMLLDDEEIVKSAHKLIEAVFIKIKYKLRNICFQV